MSQAMTVRAPARPRTASSRSGKSDERVGAEQDQRVDAAVGRGLRGCRCSRGPARPAPCPRRSRTSSRPASSPTRPGQHARRETHVEGAVDVGPAEGRQEAGPRSSPQDGRRGGGDVRARVGQRGPTDDDGELALAQHLDGPGDVLGIGAGRGAAVAEERVERLDRLARAVAHRGDRVLVEAGGCGREHDDLHPVLDDRVAQPQVQDRQLLLQVGTEQEDRASGRAHLVDRRAREAQHGGRRQAVAELRVDVVGADDALGQLGPGVRRLVGEAGAADARRRPTGPLRSSPSSSATAAAPSASDQRASASSPPERRPQHRPAQAVGVADRLEVEPALVAEPAPVHRVDVDALVAEHLVAGRVDHDAATHRARRAGGLGLLEVPRPGLEAVRRRGERADRADLHGVAAEVRGERVVRERVDLGLVAAVLEVDQRVAGHLLREPGAAVAEDAALAVELHEVADRDRLLEVPLLLDHPRLAGPVGERLVLERALAALVAHGAVERVVDEEELEDAVLRLDRRRPSGCRPSCRAPPGSCSSAGAPDLGRCRSRRCTCGTCRPAACGGGSRTAGCRRRTARRRRSPARPARPRSPSPSTVIVDGLGLRLGVGHTSSDAVMLGTGSGAAV